MEMRPCGKSGIDLSVVSLGCWAFGGGSYWGPQEEASDREVVSAALDGGITYFDTAEMYNEGRSEESLGKALRGRRTQAVLGAKIPPDFTEPAVLRQHLDATLRRLQTDTVDLYFVHWPITEHCVEDAFATLDELQQEGKIRAVAVSNHGPRQMYEAFASGTRIEANQLCHNLVSRAIEVEIVPVCQERGMGVLGYMPLLQGLLADKWRSADAVPPTRSRTRHFSGARPQARHGEPGAEAEVFAALAGIRRVAAELGVPMSRLAIAWCMAKPWMTSVIVGARSPEQVRENAAAAGLRLPAEVVARLDALTRPVLDKLGPNADYWQGGENTRVR
jgi:aryl-alcohol dehydrogenase-like predicted oxidoreductase